ncbi:hypothetical protein M5K25_007441 [Dendrobium thyrsiflorum]|uniref:Retrotransposon gag domain-containing protein n=1 Tax=Dendrobium thyrsiflorum TaxID=117978 RepID=A0ABD0VDY1_DENTH
MAADKDPSVRMDLRNTPFTVQLGRGASIQLANATINTGNSGATIQFGELQFPIATASAAAVPVYGMDTEGPAGRPYAADVAARHVHPPPRRPQPAEVITVNEFPQRRVSVFKRLSNSETPTTRRVMDGKQISVLPATTTTLPTGLFVPGRNDAEASSSGGRPSRRQRRRMNAELRAQQLLQVHPSTLSAQEPKASVPTQNKFTNLKWVKRNSSTGELKQSFWEQQPQAPVPQKKKEPETLSGRVHRVLKTVKEKGLMKKKYQRPLVIEARRIPQRELPPLVTREKFKQNLQEAHRGVTLGSRVQESAAERAQQKDKQVWRPRPHERRALGKQTNMGVTSGAASQRSGPTNKTHKKWIPKKVPFDNPLDGRHPGESSRESHHQPIASSQEEASFDRSPRIEEFFMLGDEPEIQWKRRSGIRKREDDENDEETMRVEVVYMVEHDDEPPLLRVYRRQHGAGSTAGRDEDSSENEEEEEFEENPLFADAATLAEAQRQMHRQMKAKDKEIAQLNAKMTEMMTQMTMMMQMIQRNITANPIPVQQTNHQATSSGLANPPAHHVPQVSGVRGSHEGGIENDRLIRQPTPQNVASTSEPVTVAQLETIINEKIKAVIALDQAEKLVGKGRPYPVEYDQAPYPKGYSVPKFNTFNGSGNNNPRQHLAQFKATCGNTGGNDALLFRQFVSSLTATAFEWYAELPNDSVKTFAELETMFVKRFASATEKITIADLALDKRKREESVTKYITRWRNLSMKCEQQLEEEHAVQLLMGNIDDKMQPFLCMATITTFQDLLDRVAKFEKLNLSRSENHSDKPKKVKTSDARNGETYSMSSLRPNKGKHVAYNVDKGKQPMQYEDKPKQAYNPNSQPKLILGGNDKPRAFQVGGERPKQTMGTGDRTFPSLKERMNKEYSFKRESVAKLFRQALKAGLELPECKRPEESKHTGDPNYCPYHRVISHPIEDCYIFKDWLERKYQKGELTLSDNVLAHPRKESTRVVTSSSIPPIEEERTEKQTQKEQWAIAISKKTTKMLKQLEGVPCVKWKSPTEPVLDLKALPIAQTSTFKQRPNQAGSSKPGKEKSSKRKTKLKKFKEKMTATQRAIDSLDEYYQTVRRPIKLADFMSELKVAEAEEANEELFSVETCRVISVTAMATTKDKYDEELAVEICLATSSMDYSSEEDLYFPREVESEHDITSQMEHVQLEGDSEPDDAKYFIPKKQKPSSSLEAKASSSKAAKRPGQEGEKKQVWRKKATPTLPKTVVIPKERKKVPHLGSDTEEEDVTSTKSQKVCQSTAKKKKKVEYSDSDYDYESTYASTVQCVFSRRIGSLSISDSAFVATRIPMQHFKEITPREVYNVEELITFYVPPHRKKGGPGSLFYKAGEREEETNCDWFHRLVDSGELIPTRMPTYNTKNIRRMLRRQANTRTSKQQLRFCLNLWLLSEVQGIVLFNTPKL